MKIINQNQEIHLENRTEISVEEINVHNFPEVVEACIDK